MSTFYIVLKFVTFTLNRYKCPKCRAPFCCVQCSKDHKANQCKDTADTASKSNNGAACGVESQYTSSIVINKAVRKRNHDEVDSDDDEPGFNITPEMKQQLQKSTWLRNELKDQGLRYLIGNVDAASDVEDNDATDSNRNKGKKMFEGISPRVLALARSKQSHPKFATFIDKMLLTAGVLKPVDGVGGDGQLTLAPVPRRCDADIARCDEESKSSSSDDNDSSDSDSSSQDESGSSEEDGEQT